MTDWTVTPDLIFVLLVFLLGIASIVWGIWRLRHQRRPVTAKQVARWHKRARGLGFYALEWLPPDQAVVFTQLDRRLAGRISLGAGIGTALGCLTLLVLMRLPQSMYYSDLSSLELAGTVYPGVILGACVGVLWGFSSMPRQPRGTPPRYHAGITPRWLPLIGPALIALVESAISISAALRLPFLPPYTPNYSGDMLLPSWVLLIAPIPLLLVVGMLEVATHRIAALPPLVLPIESPMTAPYDYKQRNSYITILSIFAGVSLIYTGIPLLSHVEGNLESLYSWLIFACQFGIIPVIFLAWAIGMLIIVSQHRRPYNVAALYYPQPQTPPTI